MGKVCAVTCAKGGGRKSARSSGLKSSGAKADNVTTTRSTRSRKGKSLNEETISQQSGPSSSSACGRDSNDVPASTSRQRFTGKRKPAAKRKGRRKKIAAQQSVVESEEEYDKEEQENGQNSLEQPDAAGKTQKDEQISQEESDASYDEHDGQKSCEELDADGNERDVSQSQEDQDAECEVQEDCQESQFELAANINKEDEQKSQIDISDFEVKKHNKQESLNESDADANAHEDLKIKEGLEVDAKEDSQESHDQSDPDLNEQSGQNSAEELDDMEADLEEMEGDQKQQDETEADMEVVEGHQKQQDEAEVDIEEIEDDQKQQYEPNADGDKQENECLVEAGVCQNQPDTNMELQKLETIKEQRAKQSTCQKDADVKDTVNYHTADTKLNVEAVSDHDYSFIKQDDNQKLSQECCNEEKEQIVFPEQSSSSRPPAVFSDTIISLPTLIKSSSEDAAYPKPAADSLCEKETDLVYTHSVFGSPSANSTAEDHSNIDQDSLATSEIKQDESLESQDNNESIPMDCDSPESGNASPAGDIVVESAVPTVQTLPAQQTQGKDECQQNKVQEHKSETKSEDQKSSDKTDKRPRKSRFHSPTTTWSPKSESRQERSRRSSSQDRSRHASSPRRSRGREREDDCGGSRRNRSRDKYSRRRSRSHSRNRSRSRSRSRNRTNHRGSSSERNDSRAHSPRKRGSWGGDNWRSSHSHNSNWRNNSDRPGRESCSPSNGSHHPSENSPDRSQSKNLQWGKDRSWVNNDGREREKPQEKFDAPSDSLNRGGKGRGFDQGHITGRGRGGQRFSGQYGESSDNWWPQRNSFSGMVNDTGNDAYSNFNENRPGGKRKESESSDPPLDRSGWSAASSWAVRRTLPADVQNYYSQRGRGPGPGGSIWNKQDDEQPAVGVSKQSGMLKKYFFIY